MKRREFIGIVVGAAAWPLAAQAQQAERVRRIGVLVGETEAESDPVIQDWISTFRSTLASLGWIEGRNLVLDHRPASDFQLLAQSEPDAILINGTPRTLALRQLTSTIPIVFVNATDPLASGLIANLAHPGGNVTGFSNLEFSVGGKWLGLLKEVAPDIKRVMVVMILNNAGNEGELKAIQEAGVKLGLEVAAARVADREALANALDTFGVETSGGLIVLTNTIALVNRDVIIERAARYRLPALYPDRPYVVDGGLMSYGPKSTEVFKKAAVYVDRILRGEKAGDLPVEYPSNYGLIVNNRTEKAIGITLPESFLLLADEVIE